MSNGRWASRVYIGNDDKCDACGKNERSGVSFGFEAPVICFICMGVAKLLETLDRHKKPLFIETARKRGSDDG